jgi:hypothetical protein
MRRQSDARPKKIGARKDGSDVYHTRFLYRIDVWTIDGEQVIEHLAGVEDSELAVATYHAARKRGQARPSPCAKAPAHPNSENVARRGPYSLPVSSAFAAWIGSLPSER